MECARRPSITTTAFFRHTAYQETLPRCTVGSRIVTLPIALLYSAPEQLVIAAMHQSEAGRDKPFGALAAWCSAASEKILAAPALLGVVWTSLADLAVEACLAAG